MTEEDIILEYEAYLAYEGEALKKCPRCEAETHRKQCPYCVVALTGDKEADDLFDRIEKGEDVDLSVLGGKREASLIEVVKKEEFEPVKRGDK